MRKSVVVLALLALLVGACGDDDADVAATSTSVAEATSSTAVAPNSEIRTANDPKLGAILVDAAGMTLYRNTKEDGGTIACTGQCAVNWPPFLQAGAAPRAGTGVTGVISTIARPEGGQQVTYNGLPLYRWINDKAPGDVTGQGVAGIWFVVAPDAKPGSTTATTARTGTTGAGGTTTASTQRTTSTTRGGTTTSERTTTSTTMAAGSTGTTYCAYPPCY